MTVDSVERTTDATEPSPVRETTVRTDTHQVFPTAPSRPERSRRIVVLAFGLIQLLVGARLLLLLLDARETNGIVAAILAVSQRLVAPFEGILRTDSLRSAGSTLDVAAVVAFVGWTALELILLWAISVFRRDPA
jgi:hypothetical protein